MPDSPAFAWICRELEASTPLDRLESRGTVRIALKSAGLDAGSVQPSQMRVVIERLLPKELSVRGVGDAQPLCLRWAEAIEQIDSGPRPDSPDEVFRRIGRS